MSWKRRVAIFFIALLVLAFIIFAGLVAAYFYLPQYMQNNILPEAAKRIGIKDFFVKVRKLGFNGSDLGSLRIGSPDKPSLLVESVRVDYTAARLGFEKHIDQLTLSGVELNCGLKDGKFYIRGLDLDKLTGDLKSANEESFGIEATSEKAPIAIGLIKASNVVIIFDWNGKTFRLPMNCVLKPTPDFSSVNIEAELYPRGQKARVEIQLDLKTKTMSAKIHSDFLKLSRFADFYSLTPDVEIEGDASLKATAKLSWAPFSMSYAKADIKIKRSSFRHKNIILRNSLSSENIEVPVNLSIEGGENSWSLSLSSISIVEPIPARIVTLDIKASAKEGEVKASGNCRMTVKAFKGASAVQFSLDDELVVNGQYSIAFNRKTADWQFKAGTISDVGQFCQAKLDGTRINFENPSFEISGKGKGMKSGEAKFAAKVEKLEARRNKDNVKMPEPKIKADMKFIGNSKGQFMVNSSAWLSAKQISCKSELGEVAIPAFSLEAKVDFDTIENRKCSFLMKLGQTRASFKNIKLDLPSLRVAGRLSGEEASGFPAINGEVEFHDAYAIVNEKINMKCISAKLPFKWPCKKDGEKGSVSIKSIHFEDMKLGSFKATLSQKEKILNFKGENRNDILPDYSLQFDGSAGLLEDESFFAGLNFRAPAYKVRTPFDIGAIAPKANGITFQGEFEFDGAVSYGSKGLDSSINAKVVNSLIELKEKEITVEGFNLELSLQDLLKFKSAPRQKLSFRRASLGKLYVSAGEIEFQTESAKSVFIEKCAFKWCDGNVYAPAARFSPEMEEYNVVLYCDRVKLAKLLEQFGAARAVGEGALNGRLPIKYCHGKLDFKDGFLYSTPGESGTVKVTGADVLASSLPKDADNIQVAQVELAKEALEDFDYEWAKLTLNTEGDKVILTMQLDGKPAKPLPFIYDKERGGFVRVKTKSLFQGIRLDVNFTLPLNKLLEYGGGIKKIMNKINQ